MDWIYWLVYAIIVSLAAYYAARRAQRGSGLEPGIVEQPSVNQGDRVGMLFGTREIKSPKIVWMGSTIATAIKK